MRKFFLIPLLACFSCVMAWAGATITVGDGGTYAATSAGLQEAINAANGGDVIELTSNIAYPASPTRTDLINIDKSITLDGQGYAITGYGYCNYRLDGKATYQPTHLAINANHDKSGLNVVIKNLKLDKNVSKYALNGLGEEAVSGCPTSAVRYFGIGVFDGVNSLLIEKDTFTTSIGGNSQIICVQGTSSTPLELTINDSYLNATQGSGYPTYFLKPVDLEINNSKIEGYCGLYFKPDLAPFATNNQPRAYWYGTGNYGSTGSVVVANNTLFLSKNPHDTGDNDFGILAMEEGGINITLNNCGLDAEALKSIQQCLFLISSWAPLENRATNNVLTITGDNSHMNGTLIDATWYAVKQNNGASTLYENGYDSKAGKTCDPFSAFTGDIQVIIEGGTYNFNPKTYQYNMHVSTEDPHYADGAAEPTVFTKKGVTIPSTHDVQVVKQGDVTLYRVVKKVEKDGSGDPLYDLNDDVPTDVAGEGNNPSTSFELSTGSEMELNQATTKAGYVQVKDNGSSQATTVKVGKVESETKVNQTLVINNGLDVQGDSKVEVQAGSALIIGEGGITTQNPENIVIEADKEGAATLLLDPAITVNQTPELTVKMVAQNVGKIGTNYFWHRFALPVDEVHVDAVDPSKSTWSKDGHSYGTLLYKWDYTNNKWASLADVSEMQPFYGYTMTITEEVANPGELKNAGYIFKGKLMGNVPSILNFTRQGYNYFGNSYTGYISIVKLVDELIGNDNLDGTVWMWDPTAQQYEGIPLNDLKNNPTATRYTGANSWKAEVAPMQTFILRLMTEETGTKANIDYATAVWGNPRYEDITGASPAPARRVANTNETYARIIVTAANGKADAVNFQEDVNFSDANDRGYDASKYMNERTINVYATVNGENYSTVATDNIEGKKLTINTIDEIAYTISFADIEGSEYALRDNVTNQVINIEAGATYEFAAQPNSTIADRFEIVSRANMPTAIENTEVKANVKGIYTIMGQYLGENFDILPAGVYVVDGVKIVK